MNRWSNTTTASPPVECEAVVNLLAAEGTPDCREDVLEAIASHLEQCEGCRKAFDDEAPEVALPPLTDRIGADVLTKFGLHGDASLGGPLAALFFSERRGDMTDEQETSGGTCEVVVFPDPRSADVAALPPAPDRFEGQFQPGQVLTGSMGTYIVTGLKRSNDFSETYEAVVQGYVAGSRLQEQEQRKVMIKIPRVAADMSEQAASGRLQLLAGLLQGVVRTQRGLVACEHVAQVIDHGEYDHRLNVHTSPSVFVVYRYVDGVDLVQFMNEQHGGRFTGLARAGFFAWARTLTTAVRETHQCLVIHGDICPRNIIVERGTFKPVFVDLGESQFVEAMNRTGALRANPYRAPDDEKTPSSDIFSLGGSLFFLATGSDPHGLGHCNGIERLKQQVEERIREVNPELFEEEGGVVDVIARCLRKQDRMQHAAQLLQDIENCDPSPVPGKLVDTVGQLHTLADQLDGAGNALFHWVAGLRLRSLVETLSDMNRGVLDFSGDSKDVCTAACALNRALVAGDEFLAISLPQFWYPGNMGINGRFLTTNRMAAARGVRIQRILVLDTDLDDPHLEEVVAAQRKVAADLKYSKNYIVKCIVMSPEERRQFIREGKHFGLFVRQSDCIAMFPVYSEQGKLVTLRFRTDETLIRGLRGLFHRCLEEAFPLADLDLPVRPRGSGEHLVEARDFRKGAVL